MLDNILNIIKDQATKIVDSNSEIPEEKRQATIQTTTSALANGLKDNLNMGNLSNLSNLFSGDAKTASTMNPLTETLKNTVSNALVQQVGLSSGIANTISGTIVPAIFSIFSRKANDPDDKGFNLDSLMGAFTGNKSNSGNGGLLNSLGNLFK